MQYYQNNFQDIPNIILIVFYYNQHQIQYLLEHLVYIPLSLNLYIYQYNISNNNNNNIMYVYNNGVNK